MSGRYPKSWRMRATSTHTAAVAPPTAKKWFSIRNAAEPVAEIYVYDEIGMWGLSASDFSRQLEEITAPRIDLRVNSPGGEVFDAIAIHGALVRHHATVTTYIDSLAASAASIVAMAGDRIVAGENSQVMIHKAWGLCAGNADDMTAQAAVLARCDDTISNIYAKRAGGPASKWLKAMKAETWYDATEAVAAGLADEVGDTKAAPFVPDETDIAAQFRAGLTAAAARLPSRRVEPPESVGMAVSDALHNAFESDPDLIEWRDGEPFLTPEAAADPGWRRRDQRRRMERGDR